MLVCFLQSYLHYTQYRGKQTKNAMSSTLYHRLLDHQTTAVILLNNELRVEYMNSAAEALLATSGARMLGQDLEQVFTEPTPTQNEMHEALSSGQPYTKRETQLNLHHNGSLTVDYTVTPIAEGQVYLIIEIFPRDRWLRISREENLMGQQEASRLLIRGLAHEIKNPLGGIRGAAQLLARELNNEQQADYTDIIIAEADRLRNLVDQMLGPNRQVDFEALNIHEALEHVAHLVEQESNGLIGIIRDYDPSIPNIKGNREQLIQAFLNVIRNAMQAITAADLTDPGRITIRSRTARQITLANRRHRMVCRIDIIDNGPGIPEELKDTIFYPMISGSASGTGLGLTIAQHIVNQHQGLIQYQSHPGETCFTLFIPFEETHDLRGNT